MTSDILPSLGMPSTRSTESVGGLFECALIASWDPGGHEQPAKINELASRGNADQTGKGNANRIICFLRKIESHLHLFTDEERFALIGYP